MADTERNISIHPVLEEPCLSHERRIRNCPCRTSPSSQTPRSDASSPWWLPDRGQKSLSFLPQTNWESGVHLQIIGKWKFNVRTIEDACKAHPTVLIYSPLRNFYYSTKKKLWKKNGAFYNYQIKNSQKKTSTYIDLRLEALYSVKQKC